MQFFPLNGFILILDPKSFVLLPHILDLIDGDDFLVPLLLLYLLHLFFDLQIDFIGNSYLAFEPGLLLPVLRDDFFQLPDLLSLLVMLQFSVFYSLFKFLNFQI